MRLSLFLLALLGFTGSGALKGEAPGTSGNSHLEELRFLVGGTWHGEAAGSDKNKPLQIESHFEWTANRQGIRFDSFWIFDGKPYPYTSGVYLYSPAKKQIILVYSDSEGGLTEGSVLNHDGVFEHTLTVTDKDAKSEVVRTRLARHDDGTFVNQIMRMNEGKWQIFVEVHYRRIEPSP